MEHNRNDGHNPIPYITIQPNIGLDSEVRHSVVALLNILLADETVLTTNTRSAYWNVRGAGFFELHHLFETQYQLLAKRSDQIAERSRMLGGFATGNLTKILEHTRLLEQSGDIPEILALLADHESVIRFLRDDARKCREEYEDEGTFDLLVSTMRLHEKMAWMLRSCIGHDPMDGDKQAE